MFTYSFTHLASGLAQTSRSFLVMNLSREVGRCYSPRWGKGHEGLVSLPRHMLTCPVIRASSQGNHVPSRLPSHKPPSIRGLQSLLKPRGEGEIRVPWESHPPCSDVPGHIQCRGEPGCSAWATGISGARLAGGTLCALGSSPLGSPVGYTGTSFSHLIPSTEMVQGDHLFLS